MKREPEGIFQESHLSSTSTTDTSNIFTFKDYIHLFKIDNMPRHLVYPALSGILVGKLCTDDKNLLNARVHYVDTSLEESKGIFDCSYYNQLTYSHTNYEGLEYDIDEFKISRLLVPLNNTKLCPLLTCKFI